jgi:Hemerythrin HHE cation binding domain
MKQFIRVVGSAAAGRDSIDLSPGAVRELVLREHMHLRRLLGEAFASARQVSAGCLRAADVRAMRDAARAAYTALVEHTELEDRLLAPVLETIDAWGRVRANDLRREHALQRNALARALLILEQPNASAAGLAATIEDLLEEVRADMEREESELLRSELPMDEMITVHTCGG